MSESSQNSLNENPVYYATESKPRVNNTYIFDSFGTSSKEDNRIQRGSVTELRPTSNPFAEGSIYSTPRFALLDSNSAHINNYDNGPIELDLTGEEYQTPKFGDPTSLAKLANCTTKPKKIEEGSSA